jgi:hypothetical protein
MDKLKIAISYDCRGILPKTGETLDDYLARAKKLIDMSAELKANPQKLKRRMFDNNWNEKYVNNLGEITVCTLEDSLDIVDKIYGMRPDWAAGFSVKNVDQSERIFNRTAGYETNLKVNGVKIPIFLVEAYKDKHERADVEAHEMVHVTRDPIDSARFDEKQIEFFSHLIDWRNFTEGRAREHDFAIKWYKEHPENLSKEILSRYEPRKVNLDLAEELRSFICRAHINTECMINGTFFIPALIGVAAGSLALINFAFGYPPILEGSFAISGLMTGIAPELLSYLTIEHKAKSFSRAFAAVKTSLEENYGNNAGYVLGRMSSPEVIEAWKTNKENPDVKSYVKKADGLRWNLIRHRLATA